jgi:3-hydroxyisobutyrate dehydrogenase-like beta-hydroxyacid dehydrogenase
MTLRVGVIGVGMIGKPIVECLAKAGFHVAVYDVRDEAVAALKTTNITACKS